MALMPNILPNSLNMPAPRYIDGWVENWKPNEADFIGKDLLPEEAHFFDSVTWEELSGVAGMLPAHALGTAPQELTPRSRKERTEFPFYFGGSLKYTEKEFLRIRALGQYGQLAGRQLIDTGNEQMVSMLAARREWSRWQAMGGSLNINENGVLRTITYPVTTIANPSTLWSVISSASPIVNLQGWALLFRGLGSGNLRCYYNQQVAGLLSANAGIQLAVRANPMANQIGTDNIGKALSMLVGNIDFIQYDAGALDADGVTYKPFIADNTIVLVKPAPNGQRLGAWKTTISTQLGGYQTPRPGMFGWVEDKTSNSKIPSYEHGIGQYGVPILKFPGNFAKVTIGA